MLVKKVLFKNEIRFVLRLMDESAFRITATREVSSLNELEYSNRANKLKEKLYRTALLYLGSETAALDAVDEAVYRGFLSCKSLRQPEFFSTWLTRILINVCNSELRRRKRELAVDELPETSVEQFDSLPLRDAIRRLPRELRVIVTLRYISGYTIAETARILALPAGTVSTRQRKALSLLRLELSEEDQA